MTLKGLKEKTANNGFITGAKKVLLTTSIVSALVLASTPVAHAAVEANNILGDAQVAQDRTAIKLTDARDISLEFYGFDKYGNQTITMDEIRKAIELSDILNGYFFDAVAYTNTTKQEVLDLDVDKLYEEYIIARYNKVDKTAQFCEEHLEDKPAIDAYITFACKTVANNIKNEIASILQSDYKANRYYITQDAKTLVANNSLYVVIEVDGQTQIVELIGEAAADVVTLVSGLENHANTALLNLAGLSSEYENTFAYNGVEANTNESVWLSFPDEGKQEKIEAGIGLYEDLSTGHTYEIFTNAYTIDRSLTEEEKDMLRRLGYDEVQLEMAIRREAELSKYNEYTYTR